MLNGWVHELLPNGGGFVLRSGATLTGLRCDTGSLEVRAALRELRPESVVEAVAVHDPEGDGHELTCLELRVLNQPVRIPFTARTRAATSSQVRAKYRYLEFRDPDVQHVLRTRHRLVHAMGCRLDEHGFIAVDTPLLSEPTPSGAREFIVASPRRDGVGYALPQSAQVYGQLVVAGGVDRYYQLCHCFRDEDLRADRQPEFTQLQVEMAFADRDAVIAVLEDALGAALAAVGVSVPSPFPRLSYADVVREYGTDKPDLRVDPQIVVLPFRADGAAHELLVVTPSPISVPIDGRSWEQLERRAAKRGMALRGFVDPQLARRRFVALRLGADEALEAYGRVNEWAPGLAPVWQGPRRAIARLRKLLYRTYAAEDTRPDGLRFAWVVDMPLFERDEESGALLPANHPFVAPADQEAFASARTQAELVGLASTSFDLVLDGEEIGSGSVVNHRLDVQLRILQHLRLSRTDIRAAFGPVLEAMAYGAPPIGGFGLGIERLVARVCGRDKIRDVMAFPKTKQGYCPVLRRR